MSDILKWLSVACAAGAIAARRRARHLENASGMGFAGISDEIPDCVKKWWAKEKERMDRAFAERSRARR